MLRYYQKALKELKKSNDKQEAVGEVEELHHEQVVNGQTSVNNRKRKKSDQQKSCDTHVAKRDSELKKKKKRKKSKEDWTVIEAVTRHDSVDANEVRKRVKEKKKKKRKKKRLESHFHAGNSNERESFSTLFIESRIDPPIMSNNKEKTKKRKRECLTEFSGGTVNKSKHSAKTSKPQKRRDRELRDEMRESNFSCNGRTENLQALNSLESSNLIPTTNTSTFSFETSPRSSPQSSMHVSKKSSQSGKELAKENQKLKTRKKRTKDLKSTKASSTDNILNSNSNGTVVVRERAEPTLNMDKAKLREAVKISNKIHETWTISKERLEALAKEGE